MERLVLVLRWKQRRMSAVAFGREPATQTNAKTQSARSSPHQVRLLRAAEARAEPVAADNPDHHQDTGDDLSP
jgi:hypothetical protein